MAGDLWVKVKEGLGQPPRDGGLHGSDLASMAPWWRSQMSITSLYYRESSLNASRPGGASLDCRPALSHDGRGLDSRFSCRRRRQGSSWPHWSTVATPGLGRSPPVQPTILYLWPNLVRVHGCRWICVSSSMLQMEHHSLLLLSMEDRSQVLLSPHLVASQYHNRRYGIGPDNLQIVGISAKFSSLHDPELSWNEIWWTCCIFQRQECE